MKVIIELNEHVSIESASNNEEEVIIKFVIGEDEESSAFARCKIDDLKLAIRKLTAK